MADVQPTSISPDEGRRRWQRVESIAKSMGFVGRVEYQNVETDRQSLRGKAKYDAIRAGVDAVQAAKQVDQLRQLLELVL